MKKLVVLIFVLIGILSFSDKTITIKSRSYCTDFLGITGYDDDIQTTEEGTPWEYYMFGRCVINGKTYYGTDSQDMGSRAALRIYFDSYPQKNYITNLISNSEKVYLKIGVTAVDKGYGNWEINVKKIEIT